MNEFQKVRIDRACAGLGLEHLAPFWGADPERHLRELLAQRFDIIFTGVAAEGQGTIMAAITAGYDAGRQI